MPTSRHCPHCHAEIDAAAIAAGQCGECGQDLPELPEVDRGAETLASFELSEELSDDLSEDEGHGTLDLSEALDEPGTIDFAAEQTIDFDGPSDDSISLEMVTSQWEDNIEGEPNNTNATIKQRETVAGPFVSRSSLVVKSRQVRTPQQVPKPFASPVDAPDYELLNVLGEGGMGVVYSARQSSIARTVAVKMLKSGDAKHDDQREKFISEAVVTGELEHPNIVPIYDLGSNEAGALFYSMKRVRGTPWNKVVQEKSLDENLSILLRVADAVAFAHANGVVHRDLKPENVMLGDFGEVLVMDWGLARISPDFPNAESVSQSDAMGGTPAYMAPEMAMGPVEKITAASDIYLLGAILFEIVTGRPPHSGKTVIQCLRAVSENRIVETEHKGELVDIARRAMATQPLDRYPTVQAFQEAIRQYQSHAESIALTDRAEQNLALADEQDAYDVYAQVVYGLGEALELWPGNERATQILSSARLEYARSALGKGDYDLGISLLDEKDESHRQTLDELTAARRERAARQRRLRLMKGAVALLIAAVIGTISIAFVAVRSQRNEARTQRDRAVTAEAEATQNYNAAEAARKTAETQRQRAETQRERAESERQRAEREKDRAEQERERAEEQRQLAVEAKQSEEYGAYVARIGLAKAKIEENSFDRAGQLLDECTPELRDWEWGRLAYLCRLSLRTWRLDSPVEAVAFAPDGQHFASGGWDGKARLWAVDADQCEHTFDHGQYVHAVAYDRTGKRFATGSSDRMIRIYRTSDGEILHTLAGHDDGVLSVRFSPDGRQLVSSGYDNTARLWDLESGQCIQVLRGHSWWVWSAEFSPDGRRIVTAGQDGKAVVWQRAGESGPFEMLTEFARHRGPVYVARFSPDGRQVATGGYDGRVLLWNPDEVQPVDLARRLDGLPDPPAPFRELAGHTAPVRALAYSPQGEVLASGGQDNVIRIWELPSGELDKTLRGHASGVRGCDFSADGRQLLSAGRDHQIKLWEPATYAEQVVLGGPDASQPRDAVLDARFSRDGRQVVTANRDRTAAVWDVVTGKVVQRMVEGHDFLASSAVFSADGSRLATGAGDGTTRVWDVATGTEIIQLKSTGRTAALDVADNGRWIATGAEGGKAVVWDAQTGSQLAELAGHESDVTAVCFAPGSRLVATGDDRGLCRLWQYDPASGKWSEDHQLRGHSRTITALGFIDGGSRLISASGDNTCGVWDVATGREIRDAILRHPDWVTDMDLSGDGRLALTCCDDGRLRLWSLADSRLVRTVGSQGDESVYTSIDLSPDGRYALAVSAATRTVHLWDLETGEEIAGEEIAGDPSALVKPAGGAKAWLDFRGLGGLVWSAQFTPDGRGVLTVGGNDARLWDRQTRKLLVRFSPHGVVASADISPDGRLLVTGSWDQSAKLWDIATGRATLKFDRVHRGYVNSVRFSPDGRQVLTASDDGTARLWDVATGRPLPTVLQVEGTRMHHAAFSADGRQVLTTSSDKLARIWDIATGQMQVELKGHTWGVLCGEFSRDGRQVLTGSEDNTAIIWDAATGKVLHTLAGHTGSVTAVAISPDGHRVLTGSDDNLIKLWDAQTGKEILTLTGHREGVTAVEFSPDGRKALSSSRDGQVILWPTVEWKK